MDRLRVVLLGCGITLFGLLLSWSVLLVVWFPFVLINVCDTLGWQFAFPRPCVPFRALFRARLAGEAFNATTPGASVAGEPVKAALIRRHVDYHESAASLAVATTSGFVAVQTTRVLGVISALLVRLGLTGLAHGSATADIAIKRYYRRHPGVLALSIGFLFLGWLLSAGETYLILRLLGVHVALPVAVGIEAAGTAVRFASFFVPAHIGALEGGNVVAFVAFGLDSATGLSFTLVRRVRELAWVGIGFLVVAQRDQAVVDAPSLEPGA